MQQQRSSDGSRRFIPEAPVSLCTEAYACPCCRRELPRFQLRPDRAGIPRDVDCLGIPCERCLIKFRSEAYQCPH